jgi:hypothetical protein
MDTPDWNPLQVDSGADPGHNIPESGECEETRGELPSEILVFSKDHKNNGDYTTSVSHAAPMLRNTS